MSCRARAAGLDAGGSGQAGGGVALAGAGVRKGSARPAPHLRRSDCASAPEGWGSPDPGGRTRAWGPSAEGTCSGARILTPATRSLAQTFSFFVTPGYTLPIRSRISRWTSGGYSLPFLEQVILARFIAAVSDKARGRIPGWHPSALQSLGNLTKAPVTHKVVVRVSTRPEHDRPSRVNQARGLAAGHGRCGWSVLGDSGRGEHCCGNRYRDRPTHALLPGLSIETVNFSGTG